MHTTASIRNCKEIFTSFFPHRFRYSLLLQHKSIKMLLLKLKSKVRRLKALSFLLSKMNFKEFNTYILETNNYNTDEKQELKT